MKDGCFTEDTIFLLINSSLTLFGHIMLRLAVLFFIFITFFFLIYVRIDFSKIFKFYDFYLCD
jgi:hypothetical protein